MRPVIGPDTFVVPLQNGVDAPAELAVALGAAHVAAACHDQLADRSGRIRSVMSTNFIRFGELDNRPANAQAAAMRSSGAARMWKSPPTGAVAKPSRSAVSAP
jgi:2-dehydropantoate 2-reductase